MIRLCDTEGNLDSLDAQEQQTSEHNEVLKQMLPFSIA